jgi:hypothetical protein
MSERGGIGKGEAVDSTTERVKVHSAVDYNKVSKCVRDRDTQAAAAVVEEEKILQH